MSKEDRVPCMNDENPDGARDEPLREISALDMTKHLSDCLDESECMKQAIQLISSRAINATELKININERDIINPSPMAAELLVEIRKMTRLQRLEINKFYFLLEDLMTLCENLPQLSTINVQMAPTHEDYDLVEDVEQFKRSFGHLDSFRFFAMWLDENHGGEKGARFQYSLTELCLIHLPNLMFIGDPNGEYYVDMMETICTNLDRSVSTSLRYLSIEVTHLFDHLIPLCDMFPHLSHLMIKWDFGIYYSPQRLLNNLLRFPNLVYLEMIDLMSFTYLECFVKVYGKNLDTLIIIQNDSRICVSDFKTIYTNCPVLDVFIVDGIGNYDGEEAWSTQPFTHLRTLKLSMLYCGSDRPISLSNIVLGLRLEFVMLDNVYVSTSDLRGTANLVEIRQEILKQLRVFSLSVLLNEQKNLTLFEEIDLEGKRFVARLLQARPEALVKFKVSRKN